MGQLANCEYVLRCIDRALGVEGTSNSYAYSKLGYLTKQVANMEYLLKLIDRENNGWGFTGSNYGGSSYATNQAVDTLAVIRSINRGLSYTKVITYTGWGTSPAYGFQMSGSLTVPSDDNGRVMLDCRGGDNVGSITQFDAGYSAGGTDYITYSYRGGTTAAFNVTVSVKSSNIIIKNVKRGTYPRSATGTEPTLTIYYKYNLQER
jgi:hypothetical protein